MKKLNPPRMPSLIPDILFDIGKMLIEEGNQEDILKFAISGKEPYKAMKKIFMSVTTLELDLNYCIIGWGNKCTTLNFKKPHLKSLICCAGKSIKCLSLSFYTPLFQPIFNSIILMKQLVSLEISESFNNSYFLNNFLLETSSFVKHLSIPNTLMNEIIRDNFDLDSLKITNLFSNSRFVPFHFFCKTLSLSFSTGYSIRFLLKAIDDGIKNSEKFSPYVFSAKELTFDESVFYFCGFRFGNILDRIMKYFPTLELLKFISYSKDGMPMCRKFFTNVISAAANVPPKITILFQKENENSDEAINFEECKKYSEEFDFDETIPDFYCFRKTFSSAGTKSTILEYYFTQNRQSRTIQFLQLLQH